MPGTTGADPEDMQKGLAWILASLLGIGCVPPIEYSGKVKVASAELVPINPDVKTVADSDKPLFRVGDSFWLFHDGFWYRASSINGRWLRAKPPWPVRQIDQPYAYTHYRLGDRIASKQERVTESDSVRAKLMFPERSTPQ